MIQEGSKLKTIITMALPLMIGLGLYYAKKQNKQQNSPDNHITIGILQTISHAALDQAQQGFIDEMKTLMENKKEITFVIQNGEGSISQLQSMAKSIRAKSDAFYAIATPAAQALANQEHIKPIAIAAVTDPQAAGLVHDNICGTTDAVDVLAQIKLLKQLIPDAKKVALIYNPGEANSIAAVKSLDQELKKQHFEVSHIGMSNESEIKASMSIALRKADVILAPTDNLIASTMPLIAQLATTAKKVLIASDNLLVNDGALAAVGIDYYECGKLSAQILAHVLLGEKTIPELPLTTPENKTIMINETTLKKIDRSLPESLKGHVTLIQ